MTQSREFPPAIGALLRLAWQAVRDRIYEGVLAAGYTDLSRAHVLLFRWPTIDGLRPSELAVRNQLSRQAINDLLSDLEERGYLERTPDPTDGRARIVRLTERGWDLTQVISDMSFATESEWARTIGESRFDEFRSTLSELVAHAWPVEAGYTAQAEHLESVSKPPKASLADERASEGKEGHMHDRVALPADAQAPVVVQPREGALDHPTPSS